VDPAPVFQLCWHVTNDPAVILTRAIPESREALNAYVRFLLDHGYIPASAAPSLKLAALATPDDLSTLIVSINRQLDAGQTSAAVDTWNVLCNRRLIPFAPIDPQAPLTDPGFVTDFPAGGFAWRFPEIPGVTLGRGAPPASLWISFDGHQPGVCFPLLQFVPVSPGARYSVRCDPGLHWSVFDARTGIDLLAPQSARQGGELSFRAPPGGLVRLALNCARNPGYSRFTGTLTLHQVSIEPAP
jgi:hypothetical protein